MNLRVLEEHGYGSAMLRVSLSHRQDPTRVSAVAQRLRFLGDGHNKLLESIAVWLDVVAPRYFWHKFDSGRVGVTWQSKSTMHTVPARPLLRTDFAHPVPDTHLAHLSQLIAEGRWEAAKWQLPESLLQRGIVSANDMALQPIVRQRRPHRLPEWRAFIDQFIASVAHRESLEEGEVT
ncbi:MAG: hypothetical protein NTX23_06270 [Candidatus Bipolaricaulota bacterium]|nr:hypothetical protein [Candidatus Bipolaricaulota bacterium]